MFISKLAKASKITDRLEKLIKKYPRTTGAIGVGGGAYAGHRLGEILQRPVHKMLEGKEMSKEQNKKRERINNLTRPAVTGLAALYGMKKTYDIVEEHKAMKKLFRQMRKKL